MIYAGEQVDWYDGYDRCPGDPGGPMILNGVHVGIVSFGFGCGDYKPRILHVCSKATLMDRHQARNNQLFFANTIFAYGSITKATFALSPASSTILTTGVAISCGSDTSYTFSNSVDTNGTFSYNSIATYC